MQINIPMSRMGCIDDDEDEDEDTALLGLLGDMFDDFLPVCCCCCCCCNSESESESELGTGCVCRFNSEGGCCCCCCPFDNRLAEDKEEVDCEEGCLAAIIGLLDFHAFSNSLGMGLV